MKKKLISIGLVGLLLGGCTTVAQEQSEEVTEVASSERNQTSLDYPVSNVTIEMCGQITRITGNPVRECTGFNFPIWGEVERDDIKVVEFGETGAQANNHIVLIEETKGCLANSPREPQSDFTIMAMRGIYDVGTQPELTINVEVLDRDGGLNAMSDAMQRELLLRADPNNPLRGYPRCMDWETQRERYERN